MQKDDLNVHVFQIKFWGPFHSKVFKWKDMGVQPPVVILQQANIYNISIQCLGQRIIRKSDQDV